MLELNVSVILDRNNPKSMLRFNMNKKIHFLGYNLQSDIHIKR